MRTGTAVLRVALLALVGLWCAPAVATPVNDPLDRAALPVRNVGSSLLLGVTQAGKRLVAVGERGVVALSDDSGRTWRQARNVPVSVTLTAVRFVNEHVGWATGHSGVVLHTVDDGETWTRQLDGATAARIALAEARAAAAQADPQNTTTRQTLKQTELLVADGPDKPFLDLDFVDEQHGIIVGAYNLAFATADGGKTWQSWLGRTGNAKALHLYALSRQGDDVVIVGEQGLVLRSKDGGTTFERLTLPYAGSWFAVAREPAGGIVVAGLKGNAYRVDAGADTWSRLTGGSEASFVGARRGDGSTLLASQGGPVYALPDGAKELRSVPLEPFPTAISVLELPDRTLLVLTVQGPVRARRQETSK